MYTVSTVTIYCTNLLDQKKKGKKKIFIRFLHFPSIPKAQGYSLNFTISSNATNSNSKTSKSKGRKSNFSNLYLTHGVPSNLLNPIKPKIEEHCPRKQSSASNHNLSSPSTHVGVILLLVLPIRGLEQRAPAADQVIDHQDQDPDHQPDRHQRHHRKP